MKLPEHDINIGLDESQREGVITILSEILGNQHVLYMKMRNFHWNLTGERFHTLHAFYEEQYEALAIAIDETAERIRMVGGAAPGSMKAMISLASLGESEGELIDGDASIKALVADNESCVRALRDAVSKVEDDHNDAGTADFLTGLMQTHEQNAWMLRSFLR